MGVEENISIILLLKVSLIFCIYMYPKLKCVNVLTMIFLSILLQFFGLY